MKKINTRALKPSAHTLVIGKTLKTKQQWKLYVTYFLPIGRHTITIDKVHKFSTSIPSKLFDKQIAKLKKK